MRSPGAPQTPLRQRNRLALIDVLRRTGTASRVDLVRDTGLSRTTISKLVGDLVADGLVIECAEAAHASAPAVGRPPVALTLNPAAGAVVGIDFGHALVRVAVADLAGNVLVEDQRDLSVDHQAVEALDLVDELLAGLGMGLDRTVGVGVAVSAPVLRDSDDPSATSILPGWRAFATGGELEQRLGRPVLMGNDANLGALAEVRQGAGVGARNVVYVTLSGGIGAGLILDGALFTGRSGLTGELGHVVVDPTGRICKCGNRGCLETVASSAALLEPLRRIYGPNVTLEHAITMARQGDEGCLRLFTDAGRLVGQTVGTICNLVNPELVILGGDMSLVGEAMVAAVREGIARTTIPAIGRDARVVPASLGDRAEVLGAIGLVLAHTDADTIASMAAV